MKAIILHGKENISLGEFPTPVLHAGEVKVAVEYCGICGSDYHKYAGKANTHPIKYPVPLGHEISGVVAEVGEGVTQVKVGDRVIYSKFAGESFDVDGEDCLLLEAKDILALVK